MRPSLFSTLRNITPMPTVSRRGLTALALFATLGCNSLDVTNPNAPDAARALTSASAIEGIAAGTLRSFFNTYNGLSAVGPLTTQAESHTASWNNFNMNFYSSLDLDGTRNRRAWQNDPFLAGRTSIEWFWQGYYAIASSAVDVLRAIRGNTVEFGSASDRTRAEAVAELMLGAALGQIALNYDQGYFFDEATTDMAGLQLVNRRVLRDSAVTHMQRAATIAAATSFRIPAEWTNGGGSYTNVTISELANSLSAMTLAYWPRRNEENVAVDWTKVVTYASKGLSQDFVFVGDGCVAVCPEMQSWTNDVYGIRVHTRVANLLDPATQVHPYDDANYGSPPPNSPDARLGDGSFGTPDMEGDYGTIPKTANAGTDFAWIAYEAFNPVRGQYHQSNIAHIRFDESGTQSTNSIYSGYGPVPLMMRAQNSLIWAEGLIRGSGSLATAASLINETRVGRGNLAPASAADGVTGLLQRLEYENEVELLSQGASVFWNRRRSVAGLRAGTPREMPVPAKELGVRQLPLYTFGGATPQSPLPNP